MLADYHLHTENSDDSKVTMSDYVKKAEELGLDEICFTDHVEYAEASKIVRGEVDYYKNYKNFVENYHGKLSIKFGAEFGIQPDNVDYFEKYFANNPLDFVLLSCHTIDGEGLYDGKFMKNKSQKEYNEAYYSQVLEVIKEYKNYSVLAHLDLIRRYDSSYYPLEKSYPFVEQILKQVIKDGKGIEVNTSCFRYNIPDLTPSVDILKLYKNLGGEIITVGSDSHAIPHFANKIVEVRKQLSELGFKYFYTFDKMKPIHHDLIV